MSERGRLPVFPTTTRAYALLWRHRMLHAKAIWPPVVFLVAAEFLWHKMVGDAPNLPATVRAVLGSPWYMVLGAAAAWLAGLKFLLSFSVSWRRHLLLGERFDPFFFKAPFWKYLAFLALTYVWATPLFVLSLLPVAGAWLTGHASHAVALTAAIPAIVTAVVIALLIVRQVPFFNALVLDPPHPGWRRCVAAMRGNTGRYAVAWIAAMLPIGLANVLLDVGLSRFGADRHATTTALGEAAFRQTMLFLHFSLGASIGATTWTALFGEPLRNRRAG